jgi:hypothetical protein
MARPQCALRTARQRGFLAFSQEDFEARDGLRRSDLAAETGALSTVLNWDEVNGNFGGSVL